jgi:hypothetical protein
MLLASSSQLWGSSKSLLLAAVGAGALFLPCPSHAQQAPMATKDLCAESYSKSQALKLEGKLLDARAQAISCGQSNCPAVIRRECLQGLLPDLDAMIPSVVFGVRTSDGRDVPTAEIFVDRVPRLVDGKPILLDPGAHNIECEAKGFAHYQETIVASAGERNRFFSIIVKPLAPAAAPEPAPPARAEQAAASPSALPARAAADAPRDLPMATYVLSGVGIAALFSTLYFGVTGLGDAHRMQETCKPECDADDVASARTKIIVANVSFGVALAAIGASVWSALSFRAEPGRGSPAPDAGAPPRGAERALPVTIDVGSTRGGGLVNVSAHF